MLPKVSRESVIDAMQWFDVELRQSTEMQGWEDKASQKWALEWEGRLYPPKKIISQATGVPTSQFSGGPQSVSYLETLGFQVNRLDIAQQNKFTEGLLRIIEELPVAWAKPFAKENFAGLAGRSKILFAALKAAGFYDEFEHLSGYFSMGQGNWAAIPWFALFDKRITTSTQHGAYCVLLFRNDLSGVYLTFCHGVQGLENEHGMKRGREIAREKIQEMIPYCDELLEKGFRTDDGIDLRAPGKKLATSYENATAAYKFYSLDDFPTDDELFEDLDAGLRVLNNYADDQLSIQNPDANGLEALSDRLLIQASHLDELERLIRDKRQMIFYGPPGTGKTYVARELARELAGQDGQVEIVQFHPSYAYEDFIEGYRPDLIDGNRH